MKAALILVLILNVLDATLTSFVITNAMAVEMNPLMGALLDYGIAPFVIVKLGIIILSIAILWKYRYNKLARVGTNVCLLVYLLLVCYFGYVLLEVNT